MARRAIKKALKRAEEHLREGRFADAAAVYDELLRRFEQEPPSLLDHAGVIYGKVRALHGLGDHQEAIAYAESAVEILSVHRPLTEVAA